MNKISTLFLPNKGYRKDYNWNWTNYKTALKLSKNVKKKGKEHYIKIIDRNLLDIKNSIISEDPNNPNILNDEYYGVNIKDHYKMKAGIECLHEGLLEDFDMILGDLDTDPRDEFFEIVSRG